MVKFQKCYFRCDDDDDIACATLRKQAAVKSRFGKEGLLCSFKWPFDLSRAPLDAVGAFFHYASAVLWPINPMLSSDDTAAAVFFFYSSLAQLDFSCVTDAKNRIANVDLYPMRDERKWWGPRANKDLIGDTSTASNSSKLWSNGKKKSI